MIAYKAFNEKLACTLGTGIYQYEIGKEYVEASAKTVKTGFHCCENPLDILRYYSGDRARYCIVKAAGDINEDGDHRIACTRMTIVKEINLKNLLMHAIVYIMEHPKMPLSSEFRKNSDMARNGYATVYGTNPKAAGKVGDYLLLVKMKGKEIDQINLIYVDGRIIKENVYYDASEKEVKE